VQLCFVDELDYTLCCYRAVFCLVQECKQNGGNFASFTKHFKFLLFSAEAGERAYDAQLAAHPPEESFSSSEFQPLFTKTSGIQIESCDLARQGKTKILKLLGRAIRPTELPPNPFGFDVGLSSGPVPDAALRLCAHCNLDRPLKVCARCQKVRFCSPECQKEAWKTHKPDCVKFAG
jgi:hypothetical protein